jgi:hypothetical protein
MTCRGRTAASRALCNYCANPPHLHFQLMDGPNFLTANGLPYVLDRFVDWGHVPVQ